MRRKKKRYFILFIVLAFSLVLTSCKSNESKKNEVADKEVVNKVEEEKPKVLRLSGSRVSTLNQHIGTSQVSKFVNGNLLEKIYDEKTEDAIYIGNHAKDLPRTEDNKNWIFTLKDGLKWDNGEDISAESYEYSYKMLLDPKLANPSAGNIIAAFPIVNAKKYFQGECSWEEVGIKARGKELEISFETAMVENDLYGLFAGGGITSPVQESLYEEGMNEDRTETDYGTSVEKTGFSGSYRMTQWVVDQNEEFEKIEGSPLEDVYVPDKIEVREVKEVSNMTELLEAGEIDVAPIQGSFYDRYKDDPRLVEVEANSIWGVYVNSQSEKNPILKDKDFRKALFYAIDRDKPSKGVFKTFESTPYFITSGCYGIPDQRVKYKDTEVAKKVRPEGIAHEVDKAKEYFDKAYEKNGGEKIELEIVYFEGQDAMKSMVEIMKEEYESIFGEDRIEVKLKPLEFSIAYEEYKNGNYDLGLGASPQNLENPWSSMMIWSKDMEVKNAPFDNEEFDQLYKATTVGDLVLKPEERLEALGRMEEILLEELPFIPVFQDNNMRLFSDRIKLITKGKHIIGLGNGFAELQCDIVD